MYAMIVKAFKIQDGFLAHPDNEIRPRPIVIVVGDTGITARLLIDHRSRPASWLVD
jgi:hypothetical protein